MISEIWYNKYVILTSDNSFRQNKVVSKELRTYVNNLMNEFNYNTLTTIGGESIYFGLLNNNIKSINSYTNNINIYNDIELNSKIYKKKIIHSHIDYNKYKKIMNNDMLILNLPKLNINLIDQINKRYYKKIIIINCHHDNFWDRIKLLTNYKLKSRKRFLSDLFFVSVNVLEYNNEMPEFISLGDSCCCAYQLRNYNLRNNAYPFDWSKSSINKLNKVLEENFKNYSKIQLKKYNEDENTYSFTNSYNITFEHQVKILSEIKEYEQTIERRVQRFISKKNNKIIFVMMNQENRKFNINILIDNLSRYFNNFKIIYISKNKVEHELVKHVLIKTDDYTNWEYDYLNWNSILFD